LFLRKHKKEEALMNFFYCLAKRHLPSRFEFHWHQSVINLDEMISLLEQKIVWQQPKVTEEVLV
jgi:hypothetical protein